MSATPHANGGDATPLDLPDFRDYAVEVPQPAATRSESTRRWAR
jgi:xylulose-5-phosphate/fructose-6-phosphate phosphoketolase